MFSLEALEILRVPLCLLSLAFLFSATVVLAVRITVSGEVEKIKLQVVLQQMKNHEADVQLKIAEACRDVAKRNAEDKPNS